MKFPSIFTTKSIAVGALALTSLLSLTSCEDNLICQNGSSELENRVLEFDDAISGIDVSGAANVFITQGDVQEVAVYTHTNIFDAMEYEVIDGVLHTDIKGCWDYDEMDIYLTITEALTEISVSGAADVMASESITAAEVLKLDVSGAGQIDMPLEAATIETRISGSGDVLLEGTASFVDLRISGSGALKAFDLKTTHCNVDVSGSGSAEITVEGGLLDVEVSGSGDVYYKGTPDEVRTDISGSGNVEKVD